MTNEKEKPYGWIACHPKEGIFIDTFSIGDKAKSRSIDILCRYKGYYYEDDNGSCTEIDFDDASKDGWRIRPVKLVFLDEGKEK